MHCTRCRRRRCQLSALILVCVYPIAAHIGSNRQCSGGYECTSMPCMYVCMLVRSFVCWFFFFLCCFMHCILITFPLSQVNRQEFFSGVLLILLLSWIFVGVFFFSLVLQWSIFNSLEIMKHFFFMTPMEKLKQENYLKIALPFSG